MPDDEIHIYFFKPRGKSMLKGYPQPHVLYIPSWTNRLMMHGGSSLEAETPPTHSLKPKHSKQRGIYGVKINLGIVFNSGIISATFSTY